MGDDVNRRRFSLPDICLHCIAFYDDEFTNETKNSCLIFFLSMLLKRCQRERERKWRQHKHVLVSAVSFLYGVGSTTIARNNFCGWCEFVSSQQEAREQPTSKYIHQKDLITNTQKRCLQLQNSSGEEWVFELMLKPTTKNIYKRAREEWKNAKKTKEEIALKWNLFWSRRNSCFIYFAVVDEVGSVFFWTWSKQHTQ